MNLHLFDIDGTICSESWIVSNIMLQKIIWLTQKDDVIFNTWRWYISALKALQDNDFLKNHCTFVVENWTKIINSKKTIKIFNLIKKQ